MGRGELRATSDRSRSRRRRLRRRDLEPDFLVDLDAVRSAARNRRMFNAIHVERIFSKLVWAKDGDSSLQRRDARVIVASVSDLDRPYLRRWAAVLGIEDEIDEASR